MNVNTVLGDKGNETIRIHRRRFVSVGSVFLVVQSFRCFGFKYMPAPNIQGFRPTISSAFNSS